MEQIENKIEENNIVPMKKEKKKMDGDWVFIIIMSIAILSVLGYIVYLEGGLDGFVKEKIEILIKNTSMLWE